MVERVPLWERGFVLVTMFLLAWQLPPSWFRAFEDIERLDTGGETLDLFVFLGLFSVSAVLLFRNTNRLADLIVSDRWLIVFMAFTAFSSLWSYDPATSIRRAVAFVLTTVFAYYLVSRFRFRDIIGMMGLVLAVGALVSFVWIIALPQFGDSRLGWTGITANKNTLARLCLLGFVCHGAMARLSPRFRFPAAAMAVLDLVLIFGSTSATARGGVGLLFGLAIVYRWFRARKTLYGAVVASLVAAAVVGTLAVANNLPFLVALVGKDITLTGRVPLWYATIEAIMDRPLFGYGFSGFWGGWFSPNHELWLASSGFRTGHSHNGLLELLLHGGLIGASLFLATFFRAVHRSIIFVRGVPGTMGLVPLMLLSWVVIYSVSERGIVGRNLFWVMFVVVVVVIGDQVRVRQQLGVPNRLAVYGPDQLEGIEEPVLLDVSANVATSATTRRATASVE